MAYELYKEDEHVGHFEQMPDLLEYIKITLAHWNNFDEDDSITVFIKKSDEEALGINVQETIDTQDLFG